MTTTNPNAGTADGSSTPGEKAGRKILLVDDHPDTVKVIAKLLQIRGHHVEVANGCDEALAVLADRPIEIMISDIGLPVVDGHELMTRVREKHPGVYGIAMSGYGNEEDLRRSKSSGFSQHLVKPVNLATLEAAIAQVK